jgi:micrococcal nuclease
MSRRSAATWITIFVALAVVGGTVDFGGGESDQEIWRLSLSGRVVDVVDGDTVKVRLRRSTETVRYIGVDTPETVKPGEPVQCFGKPASALNRRLVSGRRVRLRLGRERRDRYGRLLAYVFLRGRGGRSVNAEIVARGYGKVLTIPPNTAHEAAYERLEQRARSRGLGLWSACPAP